MAGHRLLFDLLAATGDGKVILLGALRAPNRMKGWAG
jgi:hypothetical protein